MNLLAEASEAHRRPFLGPSADGRQRPGRSRAGGPAASLACVRGVPLLLEPGNPGGSDLDLFGFLA